MPGATLRLVLTWARLFALSVGPFWSATVAFAEGPTILILDASASMAETLGEGTRLDAAKHAAVQAVEMIYQHQPTHPIALVSFYDGCWVDHMVKEAPLDDALEDVLKGIKGLQTRAYGHTPIAQSLRLATELLDGREGRVLLVSDGQESCDEAVDLCQFSKELNAQNAFLEVSIVGLALSQTQKKALRCIPEETGGVFLEADSGEALETALGLVSRQSIEPPLARCFDNRGGLMARWCEE
ncbi:MAG: vWA domain-containing protein [Pseudomonadota bacterium]